jgi:hypothetical protein
VLGLFSSDSCIYATGLAPKREQLLVGNSGQFFHIALEDIAMMEPQTLWIWSVLERQLLVSTRQPTLAALRLSAGLIAEAINLGRVQTSFVDVDWDEVARLAAAAMFHSRADGQCVSLGTSLS